jgi:hypothetical protein
LPTDIERNHHRTFCQNNPNIPLFLSDWWLDAVCGENWGAVTSEKGGEIVATLPYYLAKRAGFTLITMPRLTQSMGPWFKYPEGQKRTSKLAFEKSVMTELIEGLPQCAMFSQTFHYTQTNWLPFHFKGYKETTRYTYVLNDLGNLDDTFASIQKNIRTEIKNAEKNDIKIETSNDIDELYRLFNMTLSKRDMATPFAIDLLQRIDSTASKRDCRRILVAKDARGVTHSAAYLVWDGKTAHYILSGSDPAHRDSGATSLTLWRAIEHASSIGRAFNFEGSMIESIEQYFRGFGGEPMPYYHVTKMNSWLLGIIRAMRS